MSEQLAPPRPLGGMTRRRRPATGRAPDGSFRRRVRLDGRVRGIRRALSTPWRSDLREAIGPVMAWVIPIMLAYIPAVLIGFLPSPC